ncbi:hypothetical protein DL89DRAFT_263802 [Linderina pennispora]|uniref:DNA polymerase zeta catalytic subunit n=1 Tax=Linderina pennispora TaxID=61395 RepID=A0A1Y1WJR8_9FUNG|nr:uncharacterized protein DL89DRAFT_263802 [Linderina pennispora]ORX73789.1 hypothetical protein DL89DRAFT_263802 [Linderina pennispora]
MKMQQQHDSQVLERRKDAPQVEAAAQRNRPGLEWSNHWRIQSLLQSALANDRQHVDHGVSGESLAMWEDVSQKLSDIGSELAQDSSSMYIANTAEGSSSWVDSWPTCREVDTGEVRLISAASEHRSHFYLNFAHNLSPGQSSLESSPAFKLDPQTFDESLLLSQSSQPSQTRPLVDESIISQGVSDSATKDHGSNCSDVDGLDDMLADAFVSASQKSEFDEFGDLDGLDNSWIEGELQKLNDYESADAAKPIPQVDGGDDDSDDFVPSDRSRRTTTHSSARRRHRVRRVLTPLALKPSPKMPQRVEQKKSSYSSDFDDQFEELQRHQELSLSASQTAGKTPSQAVKAPSRDVGSDFYIDIVRPSRSDSGSKEVHCIPSSPEPKADAIGDKSPYIGKNTNSTRVHPVNYSDIGMLTVVDKAPASIDAQSPDPSILSSDDEAPVEPSWDDTVVFRFAKPSPTAEHLAASLSRYNLPEVVTPIPFFSKTRDLPNRTKSYAGQTIKFASADPSELPVFDPVLAQDLDRSSMEQQRAARIERQQRRQQMWSPAAISATNAAMSQRAQRSSGIADGWWEFAIRPPHPHTAVAGYASVKHSAVPSQLADSADALHTPARKRQRDQSDLKWGSVLGKLSGFTNTQSMSVTPTMSSTSQQLNCIGKREKVPMSQMSLEIITSTRDWLLPDPKLDSVLCMVACMVTDKPQWDVSPYSGCRTVVWTHGTSRPLSRLGFPGHVEHLNLDDEVQMITEFTQWVCTHDPDVLCGYEVQNSSWGYLIERADVVYGMRLSSDLSRIIDPPWRRQQSGYGREQDSWSYKKGAALSIAGRHVLNVWRLMRSELALTSYSLEKIAEEVLKEKVPHFTHSKISQWFLNGPAVAGIRAIRHVMYRARADLRLLDTMDIVQRASEFASIIGIDFDSVITRGSQLRVESLMARIAHPELYILSSPTREQVAQQRAAECAPLVLEPQSRYYTDPVVVLDFQSLYPSIMIAYNYCFSTCLGSVEDAVSQAPGTKRRLGFTDVHIPPGILSKLRDHVTISPNGAVFVKPEIRKGLLGRMLQEILESRTWSDDEMLCKNLDARQLGLKLIANVTYGYAGASFSGRMPCVEIADAIVQSGRETLESAIRFIHSKHDEWGARVVYGDTDSVRQTAFKLGHEIAQALKFEKVYQPCVLLTKKRYAGWMYTAPDQTDPMLDVKGMELIIEGTMDRLFATNDLSQVKSFITDEISKVSQGEYPMMDFFIAKEVLPPHAKVSMDDMQSDARAEPQYGERVPYVVVVRPLALLNRPELHLNYQYYISKQIVPALDRVLGLVGIDVRTWGLHDSLIDVFLATKPDDDNDGLDKPVKRRPARRTLDHFYHERSCLLCRQTMPHLPDKLLRVPALMSRLARIQMGIDWACVQSDVLMAVEGCDSLDCPTMNQAQGI